MRPAHSAGRINGDSDARRQITGGPERNPPRHSSDHDQRRLVKLPAQPGQAHKEGEASRTSTVLVSCAQEAHARSRDSPMATSNGVGSRGQGSAPLYMEERAKSGGQQHRSVHLGCGRNQSHGVCRGCLD
jgi:hypothetical protein